MSFPLNQARRWIHLDFKGAVPALPRLLEWLRFLQSLGIQGVLLEPENRYPWRCWSALFKPGYSLEEWRQIRAAIEQLGMQAAPLIQVHGHMEWILRHPEYASWRENGHINEICPQHPEAGAQISRWVDEALEAFPEAPFIHLGADETWNLASCQQCQARASAHPDGRAGVYLDHVARFCRQVVARKRCPMIWADMLINENAFHLADRLPPETILVDWRYNGAGPWDSTTRLREGGRRVWGASAVRRTYDLTQTLFSLADRVENIRAWEKQLAEKSIDGLVHTTWARPRSTGGSYGPWEAALPAFLSIGGSIPEPLRRGMEINDQVAVAGSSDAIAPLLKALQDISSSDPTEQAALEWWRLGARFRALYLDAATIFVSQKGCEAIAKDVGSDAYLQGYYCQIERATQDALNTWEHDVRQWWRGREWSDADEFIACRIAGLHALLSNGSEVRRGQ